MELIITPNHEETDMFNTDSMDSKDSEIKYLKFKNRQLIEENKFLLAMLGEAIGNRTIVISEEVLERKPRFKVEENLEGDMIIRRKR